ncbi:MAG: binding-protein-dependent transport system inner rane component [Firmicutes bacterium]|nr:binding-protein-dependent transport system inner rane component [Bacillota bacterium]
MAMADKVAPAADHAVAHSSFWGKAWRRFRRHKLAMVGAVIILLLCLVAIFAPQLAPHDPLLIDTTKLRELPSLAHPMGRDEVGRDLLSRVIYGSRIALTVGFAAAGISLVVGVLCGLVAGYFGGWVDQVLMRLVDALMAFPTLLLIMATVAVFGPRLWTVVVAIGLTSWSVYARVVRASVLSLREQEFVQGARALGASGARILFRHLLPNCIAPVIVLVTLNVSNAILTESSLSFLGFGVQPPDPSWGSILSTGRKYISSAPHIATFPGIAITVVVLAFNLVGNGLRDALDPKSQY